jgi:lactate permease
MTSAVGTLKSETHAVQGSNAGTPIATIFRTGSDTLSNALFGSLQRITSQQLGIDPVLMCAANSAGGVMGKMVDAQSITIATAATEQVGNEGIIFRFVVWHSVALGAIVGIIVMLYAYVFRWAVPHGLTFVK